MKNEITKAIITGETEQKFLIALIQYSTEYGTLLLALQYSMVLAHLLVKVVSRPRVSEEKFSIFGSKSFSSKAS